jgi:hypothetical protein
MPYTLIALNILIFCYELFLCLGIGVAGYYITFGAGLGDLFFYGLLYLLTLIHLALIFLWHNKKNQRLASLLLVFVILSVLFSLKATVWRDSEYPWDGIHIFYKTL